MSETNQNNRASGWSYFRDRSVVVTGASSGIGRDVALTFARMGAQVALLARRKARLEEAADQISASGGRAIALSCDVTRRPDVQGAIEEANRTFGRIDLLVNSAGLLIPDTLDDMRPEDLERMMQVNLYGTVHAIQAALPIMKQQRGGRIINIGSLAGRRGISPLAGYSASKFALVGLTEALRIETLGTGVWVSLVMPAVINTPMSQEARYNKLLRGVPSMLALPARLVTWAVIAAAALGLPEVDVPPGAGIAEKVASLFPTATDAFLSVGTRLVQRIGDTFGKREAPPKEAAPERVARAGRRGEASQTAVQ
jgi:uncharacterized protein